MVFVVSRHYRIQNHYSTPVKLLAFYLKPFISSEECVSPFSLSLSLLISSSLAEALQLNSSDCPLDILSMPRHHSISLCIQFALVYISGHRLANPFTSFSVLPLHRY